MIPSLFSLGHPRRRHSARAQAFLPTSGAALVFFGLASGLSAGTVPPNLGNGLGKLVESNLAVTSARTTGARLENAVTVNGHTYLDAQAASYASMAISDAQDRVLVRVNPTAGKNYKSLSNTLKASVNSLTITAQDKRYQGVGVFNAYVSIDDVPTLATAPGVQSIILEIKPHVRGRVQDAALSEPEPGAVVGDVLNKLGTAFDQGVTQHRVDQINN